MNDMLLLMGWCKWRNINIIIQRKSNMIECDFIGRQTFEHRWIALITDINGERVFIDNQLEYHDYSSPDHAASSIINRSEGKIWTNESKSFHYKFPDSRDMLQIQLDIAGIKINE